MYEKQVIHKSTSMIFGLVGLIILSYYGQQVAISRGTRLLATHALCLHEKAK